MTRLLLVDVSGIFWSSWHATAGKDTDAAYMSTIGRVRRLVPNYEHVAICCDSGRSFRHELSGGTYKANRPPREAAPLEQLKRVCETFEADGLPVLSVPDFEADDILATVATWATRREDPINVHVMSTDKDLLALVDPIVSILHAQTGEIWGPEQVKAKLGVDPGQVRDFLALVGDTSDNVKGVPGVGPKHAARLLAEFGTVGGIVAALDAKDAEDNPVVKPPSILAAILGAVKDGSLELAGRLVTLRRDVPIDCSKALERTVPKSTAPDAGWAEQGDAEFEDVPAEPAPQAPAPLPVAPVAVAEPEEPASTALAIVPQGWSHALEPRSAKDAYVLAKHLFDSRLFGAYGNPDAVFATVLAGREMGIPALTALRSIHVIEGKPTLSAHLIVAMVHRSGLAEYFRLVESTDKLATYETRRKGDPGPTSITYTIEDAERAGLTRPTRQGKPSNWTVRPRPMLRKAAAVELARACFPDVAMNVYDPDEFSEAS